MRCLFLMAVVFCSLVVSACSGIGSSFLSSPTLQQSHVAVPKSKVSPTPIPFTYTTIDDPNSNTNAVNGINQLGKIVGDFGGGSGSNIPESYSAISPYSKFRNLNYPGAQGTVATSLSSNKQIAGYVIDPGTATGTFGFVRVRSLWTLFADPHEGTGNNAVTEILSIDGSGYAVGFYLNGSGVKVPFELDTTTGVFTELHPPGATSAEATGINGKDNISGWETTSSGERSFYLQSGTYYPIQYPKVQATYATGVNWQDQVIGYFLDSQNVAHGFILTGPTRGGAEQTWQVIDEPNATGGTWVTCMSNHSYITGYYVDAYGAQHGFIGTP